MPLCFLHFRVIQSGLDLELNLQIIWNMSLLDSLVNECFSIIFNQYLNCLSHFRLSYILEISTCTEIFFFTFILKYSSW